MKKESNEEKLVAELLAENGDLHDATLSLGLALSRRKRFRRRAARAALVLLPCAVAALLILRRHENLPREFDVETSKSKAPDPTVAAANTNGQIRLISDSELLELFKGKPVALVGRPGKQTLIVFEETH